jgi:D-3-phosphoglycerate dehydrogenase
MVSPLKIAILDDYQDAVRHLPCFTLLDGLEVKVFHHSARGLGQLAIRLAPFDVLVLIRERTRIDSALLKRLPNLKLICQTGRVGAHVDVDAALERGIRIVDGPGDPVATAELTWAMVLAGSRHLLQYAALLRQGLWQTSSLRPEHNRVGRVVNGKTLGIWGYGRIGQRVARYAQAFGMQVMVWGSTESRTRARNDGLIAADSRADFFAHADVLTLHLRLSDTTRHLITAEDLALMKPYALLVNTSRAELLAPAALETALRSGRPGAAAVDVFETEPLPPTASLLQLENLIATPHLGYVEQDSYQRYFQPLFEAIAAYARDRVQETR